MWDCGCQNQKMDIVINHEYSECYVCQTTFGAILEASRHHYFVWLFEDIFEF